MSTEYDYTNNDDLFAGADDAETEEFEADKLETEEAVAEPETETEKVSEENEAETESEIEESEEKADEEETEETEEEPEKEAEPAAIHVPKSRLDAEIAKRRELEAKLKELQGEGKPKAGEVNLEGLDAKSIFDKVLDGDVEGAGTALQDMIRHVAQTTAQTVTESLMPQIQNAPNVTQAQMALNQAADALVAQYDVLNPQSEGYSETLQNEVVDLRDVYIDRGYTPVEALQKAAKMVMSAEGIAAKSATPAAPKAAPKPKPNLEQKLKAAESQPPAISQQSGGEQEPAIDIMNMSDDDFDQLSEAQLARLRGDFA